MKVGRVIGQVVATLKHPDFDGHHLLVVEAEDVGSLGGGGTLLAVDRIGARVGEQVLVVDDGAAARGLYGKAGPIRAMIVGTVDAVDTNAPA
jgi:ethanolamine utilization protein EutN